MWNFCKLEAHHYHRGLTPIAEKVVLIRNTDKIPRYSRMTVTVCGNYIWQHEDGTQDYVEAGDAWELPPDYEQEKKHEVTIL